MESVARRLEKGDSTWEAARNGAANVGVAVVASAGTNMVVLLPIGLMGSFVGMIYSPFALTTLYANLASLFISFILVPTLCAVLLRVVGDRIGDLRPEGRRTAEPDEAAENAAGRVGAAETEIDDTAMKVFELSQHLKNK